MPKNQPISAECPKGNEERLIGVIDVVLDTMIDGVLIINEDCKIQFYNKACVSLFGYTHDEIMGKEVHMLLADSAHQENRGCLDEYPQNSIGEIIGVREISGRRKDGSIFSMELTVGETTKGGEHAFVGVIRDITQRKATEEAQGLLANIVDSSLDAIISKDLEGIIISWNAAAEQLFGYSASEAIDQPINLIIPPYCLEEEEHILGVIRAGKKVEHFETRRVMKNGHFLDVSLTVSPIRNAEGKIIGASKILHDITERREGEKSHEQLRQAQKMEALGQLTGGIAHDFNNLLAVILGNLDFMVERTKEDNPLRTFLKPSIEAAEHGAQLTRQLLAFGRKQTLQPKIISLNELLNYFMDMVRHTLGERISVILTLRPDLWNISVDPSQLQNALLNLAVNARDAIKGGGNLIFETQNISIDEEYGENTIFEVIPGDYILLTISDTGDGMTPEVMEKAFDPFFTTKAVGQGTGLGLSMVYGFVKQSKGQIKLYSELGHGTTIKIYLPRAEGAVLHIESEREKPVDAQKKNKCVLVVEDNKDVLKLTSAMVETMGYNVLAAENGEVARKILEQHSDIDLLLTDVMLPGELNGAALLLGRSRFIRT